MKNPRIIIRIFFGILIFYASSCSDFLNLNPISSYNSEGFYQTRKDYELAVNGIYDVLQGLTQSSIPLILESRSDNVANDATATGIYDHNFVHRFVDNESTPSLISIWRSHWVIIDRCNAIIDRIDNVIFDDEARRLHLKGEAFFFRGYAYFQLAWMYGGVPLVNRQVKADEIKTIARSTQEETFSFAANDLSQAAQFLPEVWPANDLGKATKYTAEGILARLFMFQKRYSEAIPLLESVINSGKYEMADTYEKCFLDSYDNSPEHIFQVQYRSGNLGEGNGFVARLVPEFFRSTMFPTGGGSGAMMVSYDLYNSYESGDLRRDFSIQRGYVNNSGVIDTVTLHYIKYAHGTVPNVKSDYEVNMLILRYTDIKLMYAEALNEESYQVGGRAFQILNVVRARAGLVPLLPSDVPNQESFRNFILRERRVEFACEYLRWFDLVRTGRAMDVMNNFFKLADEGSGIYKMDIYRSIFAIPQYELDLNPNKEYMWQNPGY